MNRNHKIYRNPYFTCTARGLVVVLLLQVGLPAIAQTSKDVQTQYKSWRQWQNNHRPASKAPEMQIIPETEMKSIKGRGRNPGLAGQEKWDISDKGVNLRTRNYVYSTTDISIPGAFGIPVSLTRTFNANDDREGPFGVGWSWSLDMRQAAGGLVRSKSAPIRTVASELSNARRLQTVSHDLTNLNANSTSTNTINETDGASMVDASGSQSFVWRDADGLYTNPPWDQNTYKSTYTTISWDIASGSNAGHYERDYADTTTITTPDGTVYEYQNIPQNYYNSAHTLVYTGLPVKFADGDLGGKEIFSEQVLTRVIDRHGNVNQYQYNTYSLPFTFQHEVNSIVTSATTNVNRYYVHQIQKKTANASGPSYSLIVTWDNTTFVNHPRVTSVSTYNDNNPNTALQTVSYTYPTVTSSTNPAYYSITKYTSPGGRDTHYGYNAIGASTNYEWNMSCNLSSYPYVPDEYKHAYGLLTSVYDSDNAGYVITYNDSLLPSNTTEDDYYVRVINISESNLTSTDYVDGHGTWGVTTHVLRHSNGQNSNYKLFTGTDGLASGLSVSFGIGDSGVIGSLTQVTLFSTDDKVGLTPKPSAALPFMLPIMAHHLIYEGSLNHALLREEWLKKGHFYVNPSDHYLKTELTPTLLEEQALGDDVQKLLNSGSIPDSSLTYTRDDFLGSLKSYMTKDYTYNCADQPISTITNLKSSPDGSSTSATQTYTQATYYWSKQKYYQKKIEIDPKGRRTFYDYFDSLSSIGSRGGVKLVYTDLPSYNPFTVSLGSSLSQLLNSQPTSTAVPVAKTISYNSVGQAMVGCSLQNRASGRYIYTKTFYDDTATYQPKEVIEDARGDASGTSGYYGSSNGANRITTTQYDTLGRATDTSTYALNANQSDYETPIANTFVRHLRTNYLVTNWVTDADGVVGSISNVDSSNNSTALVTYSNFTAMGKPRVVTDNLSGIQEATDIDTAKGLVNSVTESKNNVIQYKVDYTYNKTEGAASNGQDIGWKKLTPYVNGTADTDHAWKWQFKEYETNPTPTMEHRPGRVIQYAPSVYSIDPQVVDYRYDRDTGALRAARFNVVKGTSATTGHDDNLITDDVVDQHPASFSFAWYNYDPAGRLLDLRYYHVNRTAEASSSIPEIGDYSWNATGRFAYYNATTGVSLYDETSNRTGMRAYDAGSQIRSENYTYDTQDRLASATYQPSSGSSVTHSWTYDTAGNRLTDSAQGGTTAWAYDGLNELKTRPGITNGYNYDALGNLTDFNSYSVANSWDIENRLTQTTKSGSTYTYGYRPDGLRQFCQKVNNSVTSKTEYLYDGQMPVIEKDYQGGALKTTRVSMPGMRGIEAVTTITEPTDSNSSATVDTNWLWYDGHGNCVRSENPITGLTSWQWRDAWGNNDPLQGTGSTNVKDKNYCANLGHIEDDSGLTYMRARYYDPSIGRFISEDNAKHSCNWYAYADNSPILKVDVDGNAPGSIGDALKSGGLGFLIALVCGFCFALGQYATSKSDKHLMPTNLESMVMLGCAAGAFLMAFIGEYIGNSVLSCLSRSSKETTQSIIIASGTSFLVGCLSGLGASLSMEAGMILFNCFMCDHPEF